MSMRGTQSLVWHCIVIATVAGSATLGDSAKGEVTNSAADGFQIKLEIECPIESKACASAFVKEFNQWWDASHSYSGEAKNMSLDLEKQCMYEQLPDGGFVRHMEISYYQPGKALRLLGGLGPLQEMGVSGAMNVQFKAVGEKTNVSIVYNVNGSSLQQLDKIAAPVNSVLATQLSRFKKHCSK